jgi:outer membrane protein OmpA-like peptidoglycan-associated protein
MSMKPVRPPAFVAAFLVTFLVAAFFVALSLLPAASAFAQAVTAPPPAADEEPMPPSLQPLTPLQPVTPAPTSTPRTRASTDSTVVSSVELPSPEAMGPSPDTFLPSLMGPIGLYDLSTAEVGPRNHLRLALHGTYFKSSNFLVQGDDDTRVDGSFSFGYTPIQQLEIFGAFLTSSNRNVRTDPSDMQPRRDPELIKSFGDLVLGGKGVLPLSRAFTAGFEVGFRFLSSISDLSVSPSSTSLWFGPLFMADFNQLADVPLRLHGKVDYYVDNSKNLIDFSDPTISPFTHEVASFAYGIADSRLRLGFGADFAFDRWVPDVPLRLFGEYHAEIITASADPAFEGRAGDTHSRVQQWLTFGVRARVYKGLTIDAGTDLRISSVGYEFGPPVPPYDLIFGVSFPLDIDAFTRPVVVTRTAACPPVAAAAPASAEGQIAGVVKSARDGKPVAGAIVAAANRPLSRVATDPDGQFQTVELPPGPVALEVTAAGFEPTKVPAAVILGRTSKVDVTLTPKLLTGNVRGKVTDAKGQPLPASLRFSGATDAFSANADQSGSFSASLPVGPYRVTAEMPQMPSKEVTLDILDGQDKQLDIVMRAPNTDVSIAGDLIKLKQPIRFKGPAKLDAKAQSELDGVADLLQDHAEIRALRIETYWDSSAGAKAKAMTDAQAKAISDYLVKKGVAEGRLEVAGQGSAKPLVPNIGPVNKAKNRRVELHILQ